MSKITYSTKLVFNCEEDRDKIIKVLESHRFAWNEASKIQFNLSKNSIVDLHANFYKSFREQNPIIPAQIVIRAEQECLSSYRSIKSNKHKIEECCIKKKLSLRLDKRIYSYKNETFSIVSLGKRVKCKLHKYKKLSSLLENYKFLDPLLFVKNGIVYISLTFEVPETVNQQSLAVGIDLGCRVFAATSEGNLYIDKKFNKEKRELRYLKRQLQSKGTQTAKKHLQKISHKEKNINKNFIHHLTKKIISDTKADTLVVENLKSIKVKKHKYQNKNRISQIPLAEIRRVLTYKAPLYGKIVVEVCPSYTSQIDSRTGLKDGIRKGRRYIGKDGIVLDADCNAACNIAIRSKLPVSYGNILDGQAIVNWPIVR